MPNPDFSKVDIQNLKKIVNAILDHAINELKVREVSISDDQDFYWDVPTDSLFSVKEKQPELDVGRLSDDWELLQSTLKDPKLAVTLSLIHVAPLLRFIGEKIGQ